jgi:DNA modification methylase
MKTSEPVLNLNPFLDSVYSCEPVSGFTHTFYRYPARFSPSFVRAAINAFTEPGDLVLDPFMGGGTTLIEAAAAGRFAIGSDISSLSVFLAKAKSRLYENAELNQLSGWFSELDLSIRRKSSKELRWESYQKHLRDPSTWRIRKIVELVLQDSKYLRKSSQRLLARCILLRASQWALDCRKQIPSVGEFRDQLFRFAMEMIDGARQYRKSVLLAWDGQPVTPLCLNVGAADLHSNSVWNSMSCPKLIVTSPPYPGVHVLYHRWQVQGRRETPAPFWIANSLDGAGAAHYTFGDRHSRSQQKYFDGVEKCFHSLGRLCDPRTLVVQMIAFSDPIRQLPRYLDMLQCAGFREVCATQAPCEGSTPTPQERLWRQVPNRKWYASQRGSISASKEVVLFHRLAG